MSVTIADIEFDNIGYDAPVDVLYLNVGDPRAAVDWDESEEGDGVSYGADGSIVGLTILNARLRIERDRKITITVPGQRLVAKSFGDVLSVRA